VLVAAAALVSSAACLAQLELAATIELPETRGRLDHLAFDAANARLFVAALGADTIDVVDVRSARRVARWTGVKEPQGLAWSAAGSRLFVANGAADRVDAYSEGKPLGSIGGLADADNLRWEPGSDRLVVGFASSLGFIDSRELRVVRRVVLAGHPEAFELAVGSPAIFVNVPSAGHVAVVDRRSGDVVATWPVQPAARNFALAFDEARSRLFVATRQPPRLQVYDSAGRRVAELPLCGDADDLFFDAKRRSVYAVCGEGFVDVVGQHDADHYSRLQQLATSAGARTGLYVPELDTLFVAAPARSGAPATIRVYGVR
jgi:hypothetical protein